MADIDLNLTPVFEALYEERRVGRAALRALDDQLFLEPE